MNPEQSELDLLAKEVMRRCLADQDADEIRLWLKDTLNQPNTTSDDALMTWEQSFDLTKQILEKYKQRALIPEAERKVLSWPWESWNKMIDPLEDGMLGVISAPDGQGKTIYAESIAEFWAMHKNRVVFVHFELSRVLMMLRRIARHTGIIPRMVKSGQLAADQENRILDMIPILSSWDGFITYVHTPGWSMERTTAEMSKLHAEGLCDVVVVDYLEKAAASSRQLKMFGPNSFAREADNVEQLKIFSESTGIPVLMVAQMSKEGKDDKITKMDRNSMRGAGEKSEKANLVVVIKRERIDSGYSNEVNLMIDKNTMGPTGSLKQLMQPEYYRVGDIFNAQDFPGVTPRT